MSIAPAPLASTMRAQQFEQRTLHGRWMQDDEEPGLVSVIVPTFNRCDLLADAIESVRRQTYRPIELLIVDDGSTDETPRLVRGWEERTRDSSDFRVRGFQQRRGGAPAARNLGLIESRGEYIQFLDSDDALRPNKISEGVAMLSQDESCDYVWSHWTFVPHEQMAGTMAQVEPAAKQSCSPTRIAAAHLTRIPTKAVVGMFRRRLCRAIGPWNESLVRHQDWDYMTRLLGVLTHSWKIDAPLYVIREHNQGRITDIKKNKQQAITARLAAATSAEEHAQLQLKNGAPFAFRRRLFSRYLTIWRHALLSASWQSMTAAGQGMRRNFPWMRSLAPSRRTSA